MTTYIRPLTPGEQQTLDRLSDAMWRLAEHLQQLRDERAAGVATAPRMIAKTKTPSQSQLRKRSIGGKISA